MFPQEEINAELFEAALFTDHLFIYMMITAQNF